MSDNQAQTNTVNMDTTTMDTTTTHGLTTGNLISFDGEILNEELSRFDPVIKFLFTHVSMLNLFAPGNQAYGNIAFYLLSTLAIFHIDDFLDPQFWDIETMFISDTLIKTVEQANILNYLDCFQRFLVNHEVFRTIEDCQEYTEERENDRYGNSPFMQVFLPHKNGIYTAASALRRTKIWGAYMLETYDYELTPKDDASNDKSLSGIPSSPFTLVKRTPPARSPRRRPQRSKDDRSLDTQSTGSTMTNSLRSRQPSVRSHKSKRSSRTDPMINSVVIATPAQPPSRERSMFEATLPSPVTQKTVPTSYICQDLVDTFNHDQYLKCHRDDRSDFVRHWINTIILHIAVREREKFRALFCLTHPAVYGYLFRKLRTTTALPVTLIWNGKATTFFSFHQQFTGALRQRGFSYLLDPTFKSLYLSGSLIEAITCEAGYLAKLTLDQLAQDRTFIFGAIQQAVSSNSSILVTLDDPNGDGITLYYRFVEKHLYGGSHTLEKTRLQTQANTPFSIAYPGGVRQFLEDKVTAYHTLNQMDHSLYSSDKIKIQGIHDAFMLHHTTWPYAHAIATATVYSEALTTLNSLITIEAHSVDSTRLNNVQTTTSQQSTTDDNDLVLNALHVAFRDLPQELTISSELRAILSRATNNAIVHERSSHIERPSNNSGGEGTKNGERERNNAYNAMGNKNNSTPKRDVSFGAKPTTMGRQYNDRNANLVQDESTVTPSVEDDEPHEAKIKKLQSQVENLATALNDYEGSLRQVRVSMDYYNINLMHTANDHFVTAIDNGADTCVIGKGWHILNYLVGPNGKPRKANLIGYDASTRTNGLPMVTAYCVAEIEKQKYLLLVNQAVYNESQSLTLLSEFQLKHNDWIVDTTSKKHKSYNPTGYGFQQMEKGDVVIPFQLKQCLMTFNIRPPTDAELATMTPVILTDEIPWNPKDHDDTAAAFYANTVNASNSNSDLNE
jgi:hypothetical protein